MMEIVQVVYMFSHAFVYPIAFNYLILGTDKKDKPLIVATGIAASLHVLATGMMNTIPGFTSFLMFAGVGSSYIDGFLRFEAAFQWAILILSFGVLIDLVRRLIKNVHLMKHSPAIGNLIN